MHQRPKVSVILPNYNHAPYLEQRIESILEQSYQDFELILIDDNSSDGSQALLKRYERHTKVSHLIINETNSGGPFGNWEKGFELAQGEYIWIAESDDWASKYFLEKTVEAIEQDTNIGIAYTDSNVMDGKGKQLSTWKAYKKKLVHSEKWYADYQRDGRTELLENMLVVMTINNMSATLIRKSALPDMHAVKTLRGAGDWLFCGLILLEHNITYLQEPLNYYRTHAENVTKENDKSGLLLLENAQFYKIILNKLQQMGVDYSVSTQQILNRYLFKYVTTANLSPTRKKEIRQLFYQVSPAFYFKFLWMLIKYNIKSKLLNKNN